MTRLFHAALAPLTALGLLLPYPAIAHTPASGPRHPAGAPSAAAPATPDTKMPMTEGGMMPMMDQMMDGGMMCPMMGGNMIMPMMRGGMMGMMQIHPDGSAAFLKAELGITDAQNAVWMAYTGQLMPLIKKHRDTMQTMQGSDAKPHNWIERLSDSEAMLSEHLDATKKIRSAAAALYTALTPEQKKKADALMPGAAGMKMGGMHRDK